MYMDLIRASGFSWEFVILYYDKKNDNDMHFRFPYRFWIIPVILLLAALTVKAEDRSRHHSAIDSSMKAAPRPILVQLSTDWCRYCRMQQYYLEKNKDFRALLPRFYYMELDAESREPIVFNGREYTYRPNGIKTGIHELAVALGGEEELSYPAWILLDKDYRVIFRYHGVLNEAQLEALMRMITQLADEGTG